jgi:monoamine oxidase
MNLLANFLITFVALEHLYILYMEMFAWTTLGKKTFKSMPESLFEPTKALAANQGLYNGFLSAGLIWSLFISDADWHSNVGAVEVGDGYKRLIETAKRVGVELLEPSAIAPSRDSLIAIGNTLITNKNWAMAPENTLPTALKNTIPALLESTLMKDLMPNFTTLSDWRTPQYNDLDVPFSDFLKQTKNVSADVLKLINTAANYNDIGQVSTLQIMRAIHYRTNGGSKKTLSIKDGSARLPEAMAKALKSAVILNKKIVEIEQKSAQQTAVKCADGKRFRAKHVICTLPFSVLRTIKIKAAMPKAQLNAIHSLPYTAVTQLQFTPKNKFWETDNLPLNTWTNNPAVERIFGANDPITGEINKIIVWLNGNGARQMDKLSEKERLENVLTALAEIRPSTKNNLTPITQFSWGSNPFAAGAYSEFAAAQVRDFAQIMAKPVGNIHFAGEHTAVENKGMEGAMESAERVVEAILLPKR